MIRTAGPFFLPHAACTWRGADDPWSSWSLAMSIESWAPFRELTSLRERMSALLEESFVRLADRRAADGVMTLPLDVAESDDEFVIKSFLPGAKPEDLQITIQGTTLTIRGESKDEELWEGLHWHLRERRLGTFARSVRLRSEINSDAAIARFVHGVLTLTVPKIATTRRRKIEVTSTATASASVPSDRPAPPEHERPSASHTSNLPSHRPKSTAGKPEPTASMTTEQAREAHEAETARNSVASSRERMVDIGRGNQQAGRQRQ